MTWRCQNSSRLVSLDALRGGVMILMALDHVRDFFHSAAASFSPTDLKRTSVLLFLTRWLTHFCLPVFMFTAGTGAYLWRRQRNRSRTELSRFLWTRGVWFVFLELTVMQFAFNFNLSGRNLVLLLILWIFGICMVVMAALVYLPMSWLLWLSVSVIALHNWLDGIRATQFGSAAWLWQIIHQPGLLAFAQRTILISYTLLPWVGVMAAGFCFGQMFELEPTTRQRIMRRLGFGATAGFIVLRMLNLYGDPVPWSQQKNVAFTIMSFLSCTKYPGSLDFVLMTLGPAFLALAYLDRHTPRINNPLVVFGKVPLFYFVVHFYLIHLLEAFMAWLRYGNSALLFVFNPPPSMGGPQRMYPPDFGYNLWVTYGIWVVVLACLYPLCRWYAYIKTIRRSRWLSYF